MIGYLTRRVLEALPSPVPAMLEDRRMALITTWDDERVLFDVYRGDDHDGQYQVTYNDCVLLGGTQVLIGLRNAKRLDAPTVAGFEMEHGDFDEYEQHLISQGQRAVAEMRYTKRAGRVIE